MRLERVDRWTAGICFSRIFLFATFMTVASVIPLIREEWAIGAAKAGAVVTAFTLCYAVSLFGFAWAADSIGAKRAVVISAAASAATSAAFGLFARDWASATILYGLVGLSQGGVYTPMIMLFAERSKPDRRGATMGWLIASTSLGYAFSLLVSGLVLSFAGYRAVFLVTGILPSLGAVLLLRHLAGVENRIHRRTAQIGLARTIFGDRDSRLLTVGYTAHCWELLGSWAWMPSFLAASLAYSGVALADASRASAWSTAAMHLLGALAAFVMGALSDRLGRRTVLLGVAVVSATLSLSLGWLVALPAVVLVALGLAQSFLTIADSPVLTTAITEVTEPGAMGAVLAVRSLLGFGAGAVAPLAAGVAFDAATAMQLGASAVWGLTFGVLGIGGVLAAVSAGGLSRQRR